MLILYFLMAEGYPLRSRQGDHHSENKIERCVVCQEPFVCASHIHEQQDLYEHIPKPGT